MKILWTKRKVIISAPCITFCSLPDWQFEKVCMRKSFVNDDNIHPTNSGDDTCFVLILSLSILRHLGFSNTKRIQLSSKLLKPLGARYDTNNLQVIAIQILGYFLMMGRACRVLQKWGVGSMLTSFFICEAYIWGCHHTRSNWTLVLFAKVDECFVLDLICLHEINPRSFASQ